MRPAGKAFERSDQGRFFAADKSPRALHQLNVEVEAAVQDVRAQQSVFPRLFDGSIQAAHRKWILGAHIDDAFGRAHHVTADNHALQE